MELIPAVQKYHWGKPGKTSTVASLYKETLKSAGENANIDLDSPYAELWMGTHPNGPSRLKGCKKSLLDFIKENPSVVGDKVKTRFGVDDVPFLLKVLSVEQALSIQAHPDKSSAEILHRERPDLYKDPNHKPEMAIALTPFEMFCGFRAMDEIVEYLQGAPGECFSLSNSYLDFDGGLLTLSEMDSLLHFAYFVSTQGVPELREIIGDDVVNQLAEEKDKASLQKAYTRLMETSDDDIKAHLNKLLNRIKIMESKERKKLEADLIERLSQQYPGDVGILSTFFLQHFTLQPGEAVFLPANEPHAYLYGDCVECMAASDNVVRAGLTPKFKDVKTLCSMLTYEAGKEWIIEGQTCADGKGTDFNLPVEDFAVTKYESSTDFLTKPQPESCSIILCVQGRGKAIIDDGRTLNLSPGSAIFIPCNPQSSGIKIELESGSSPILLFEAYSTPKLVE